MVLKQAIYLPPILSAGQAMGNVDSWEVTLLAVAAGPGG